MWWIALSAALAFAAGWLTAPAVARLSATRPVAYNPEAELRVLAAVWAQPARLAYLLDLTPEDFANPGHARVWAVMVSCSGLNPEDIRNDEDACKIGDEFALRSPAWRSVVLRDTPSQYTELLASLTGPQFAEIASQAQDESVVDSAAEVMSAAADRTVMNGNCPIAWSEAKQAPVRTPAAVSALRKLTAGAIAAAWALTAAALLSTNLANSSALAAAALVTAWLALGTGLTVIAFIDADTMYLHVPIWATTTTLAWLAATLTAVFAQEPSRLIAGIVMAAVTAGLFEGLNFAYQKVRGTPGQGFGDTLIVLASVGVPSALTGSWMVGYAGVMGALVTAIAAFVVRKIRHQETTSQPFAFGPFLALGPLIGAAAYWAAQLN